LKFYSSQNIREVLKNVFVPMSEVEFPILFWARRTPKEPGVRGKIITHSYLFMSLTYCVGCGDDCE